NYTNPSICMFMAAITTMPAGSLHARIDRLFELSFLLRALKLEIRRASIMDILQHADSAEW
ncbi:uncharacterized protein FOMMEDRAFT_21893, partial [Fomitiporia mediterranea MF3/22]|uniref:uncharacterized protein n=1 Tax=Fomitiporia mediterranea (strain MF3/22) TaxID=694068 RepID=UPI0004409972